jgi:hypothetical protein
MTALNKNGEVADILDVNQFIPSRSAYECVAYSGALCKYAGQPGHGVTGSALQASNLAQYWYGREEGSDLAANTNGMSLLAEYDMLTGMGLHFTQVSPDVSAVKSVLLRGYPLVICGAETGMYDVGLGDHIPYTWTPTGNHAIVASGIAPDGNLLVHDTANIAPDGVRTGPRIYDASKLRLVSATAIDVPWLVEDTVIDIHNPEIAKHYKELNAHQWQSIETGKVIQYAMLDHYKTEGNSGLCGWDVLRAPVSNEIPLDSSYPHGSVKQHYENGVRYWNAATGKVLPLALYSGPGQDPRIAELTATVASLQKQVSQTPDNVALQGQLDAALARLDKIKADLV